MRSRSLHGGIFEEVEIEDNEGRRAGRCNRLTIITDNTGRVSSGEREVHRSE
jgi:hypothetical protein